MEHLKHMVCFTPVQFNRLITKLKCSPQDVDKAIEILDEIANDIKKNFFNDVKPSPDMEYKSANITKAVRDIKQFIVKGDVDGYWDFVVHSSSLYNFSDEEMQSFDSSVITDKGTTIIDEWHNIDYIFHEGLTD